VRRDGFLLLGGLLGAWQFGYGAAGARFLDGLGVRFFAFLDRRCVVDLAAALGVDVM